LKACEQLLAVHLAQVLSYLKASDRSLGLLINFNVCLLRRGVRRVIRSR
jgi:GxxExxY protein